MKTLTAAMLVLTLCFACVPAFAADASENVYWYYNESSSSPDKYIYIGDVNVGENTVEYDFEYNYDEPYLRPLLYVAFEAPSDGYYMLGFDTDSWIGSAIQVPEKHGEDGKVYGYALCEEKDNECSYIYRLSAGRNVIGIDAVMLSSGSANLNIEYLGDAVNDIVCDETLFTDMIEDYDIDIYSNNIAELSYFDYEVVFSEKTVKFEEDDLYCDIDPETGEYSLTFLDYSENADITTVKHKDVVKDIEVVNPDDCLTGIEYYDGTVDETGSEYLKEVKVTFADGTVEIYELDEHNSATIRLPNGREAYVSAYYTEHWSYEDDVLTLYEMKLVTQFAGKDYREYAINTEAADFEGNFDRLMQNNKEWFDRVNRDASYRLERLSSPEYSADEKILLVIAIPTLYTNAIYQAFCNLVEFAEYYGII